MNYFYFIRMILHTYFVPKFLHCYIKWYILFKDRTVKKLRMFLKYIFEIVKFILLQILNFTTILFVRMMQYLFHQDLFILNCFHDIDKGYSEDNKNKNQNFRYSEDNILIKENNTSYSGTPTKPLLQSIF